MQPAAIPEMGSCTANTAADINAPRRSVLLDSPKKVVRTETKYTRAFRSRWHICAWGMLRAAVLASRQL